MTSINASEQQRLDEARESGCPSIFGSARTRPGDFAYAETRRMAAALAELDCDIVTGGGPGLVAPGGIGTVLESMMVWQLLQVRHLERTPLVFVGKMWPGLVEWARSTMLATDPPLANPGDFDIPRCVTGADEAIAIIREHRERWLAAVPGTSA